jgi:predicted O-methyltransferase YrrM
MIDRIIRKIHFLSLKSGIRTFAEFKKSKSLNNLEASIEKNKIILLPYYTDYVKNVSSANMASSLELAAFMLTICQLNKYNKLLDMGSGISSFVFRLYAKSNPGVVVYSVDDDSAWLEKTREFLRSYQLDTQHTYSLDNFLALGEKDFDCVLHDLNFVEVRINYIESIMPLLNDSGVVIFDDVHKQDYLFALLKKLKQIGSKVYSVKPVTYDCYGRYSLASEIKQ